MDSSKVRAQGMPRGERVTPLLPALAGRPRFGWLAVSEVGHARILA